MTETRILYTIKGATEATGFCRSRLYELMGNGSIATVKVGRRTLIKVDSVRAYIDSLPSAKISPPR